MVLQLKLTSDYAIRFVLYLAENRDSKCTVKEVEEKMGIPSKYLYKIVRILREKKIIDTFQGHNGGIILLKNPEDITLYDVISEIEDGILINPCMRDKNCCSLKATDHCNVRRFFCALNRDIEMYLNSISIADIINDEWEDKVKLYEE